MPEMIWKYCPVCAAPLVKKYLYHASRLTCQECGYILFHDPKVVTVVVVCYKEKFLLGRRNINPYKGHWSFFSGYMERGEKVEDAAIREVKEEANLDVQLDKLIGVYSEKGSPHVIIVYQASIINNEVSCLAAQLEEVSELQFFKWEELPELVFPFDRQILNDWQKMNNKEISR